MEGRLHSQAVGENETADAALLCLRVRSVGLEVWWPGQDKGPRPYLGFAGATAGRNKPGSRSTSLKAQQELSGELHALLLLPPSRHSSLLSVIRQGG